MARIGGEEISADWSAERTSDGWEITLESRSGGRRSENPRNIHYKEGLARILTLLGARAFVLENVTLSSEKARQLAPDPDDRRVQVPNVAWPLSLSTVDDHAELGRAIQSALAPMFSTRQEPGGGNREKRITLAVSPSADTPFGFDVPAWVTDGAPAAAADVAPIGFQGSAYREAREDVTLKQRKRTEIDPANAERALAGHGKTQNALSRFLQDKGLTPLSPSADEPDFDLAWLDRDVLFVAEIKSITDLNEEGQLRLGLGQVQRYRHALAKKHQGVVIAVLVAERRPKDPSWISLCYELSTVFTWAPFDALRLPH